MGSMWKGWIWRLTSIEKKVWPFPIYITSFFSNIVFYSKDDFHQTQVEEDLVIFIAKEFVSLSFVKLAFFKRLISR
jgi:hypothetical protein